MSKAYESKKPYPREEKSVTMEAQNKIYPKSVSIKLNSREEKSVTTKAQGKMCLKYVSRENLTCVKRNSL